MNILKKIGRRLGNTRNIGIMSNMNLYKLKNSVYFVQ